MAKKIAIVISLLVAIAAYPVYNACIWLHESIVGVNDKRGGKTTESIPHLNRALGAAQVLGNWDPRRYLSFLYLGAAYEARRKYTLAEQYYKKALIQCQQQYGVTSPKTAFTLQVLGRVYKKRGDFDKAEPLFRSAVAILEPKVSGDLAEALDYLGWDIARQGRYEEAQTLLERSLTMYDQVYGRRNRFLIAPLTELGWICSQQGKKDQARSYFDQALDVAQNAKVGGDCYTLVNLKILADEYAGEERNDVANRLYQRTLSMSQEMLQSDNLFNVDILNSYARSLQRSGQTKLADNYLFQAQQIKSMGP